jgi:porphobilinogen synthase
MATDPSHVLSPGYSHDLLRKWQSTNTTYGADNVIYPLFVLDIGGQKREIKSMPGQYQWSVDRLEECLTPLVAMGLTSVILFPVMTREGDKSKNASYALNGDNPVVRAVQYLKRLFPELYLICDVCICQFTTTGDCGLFQSDPYVEGEYIHNGKTIELIAKIALHYAKAGAHMVAPSDMMDGRIAAIRDLFVGTRFERSVPIMSYSAKFASKCMYGPFRDAAHSAPTCRDRQTYQLPIGATGLAERALRRDEDEGAAILMVKPGTFYLDILRAAADGSALPMAVYQTSAEYSMFIAAANIGVFKLRDVVEESMVGFRRAGASVIISYFVPHLLQWWTEDKYAFITRLLEQGHWSAPAAAPSHTHPDNEGLRDQVHSDVLTVIKSGYPDANISDLDDYLPFASVKPLVIPQQE